MGSFSLKAAGRQGICKRVGQSMLLSTQQQGSSCVVHGDDFVFACVETDLEWARQQMEKSFLVIGRLGGDKQDVRELRVLNRVLSWRSGGIELEADPRHQEILISELEQGVRGLRTPGVKNPQRKDGDGDGAESLLNEAEARSFRSTAARASYLALDRPDLASATKELCTRMSSPTKADVSALRQVSRYLLQAPRLVYECLWQPDTNLDVFVDTDFAGCLTTRRSTSGGAAMRSSHLIKHWSSTQKGCDAELC